MLRLIVLLLLLANGVYFAWSQGYLLSLGWAPQQQSEPQRLAQQIRPQSVRVLAPAEARRVETVTNAPNECLQAGLFSDGDAAALRQVATNLLPTGSWTLEATTEPARWIVYMGKYPDADALERKKAELRQLGVSFNGLVNTELEPGISLGAFDREALATERLNAVTRSGVRTARVTLERPERRGQLLKLPAVDDTLRARLDEMRPALRGQSLRPC